MGNNDLIHFFGDKKVRTKWDDEKQKWYFSIVDVCPKKLLQDCDNSSLFSIFAADYGKVQYCDTC